MITLTNKHVAKLYYNQGRHAEAIEHFRGLVESYETSVAREQDPAAYNALAWLLVTCPEASIRDGRKAVDFASRAWEESPTWGHADTLAAAYAEASDFDSAVLWEERAMELAPVQNKTGCRKRLDSYLARRRYRDIEFK